MNTPAVKIARCPEHGLHGERTRCFVCDGPVEQVAMVPASETRFSPVTVILALWLGVWFGDAENAFAYAGAAVVALVFVLRVNREAGR